MVHKYLKFSFDGIILRDYKQQFWLKNWQRKLWGSHTFFKFLCNYIQEHSFLPSKLEGYLKMFAENESFLPKDYKLHIRISSSISFIFHSK